MEYWKKEKSVEVLHMQDGWKWGNDLDCTEDGEWGEYSPLSHDEHIERGYVQISEEEAVELALIAGYEI